jgi:hypothetical protein
MARNWRCPYCNQIQTVVDSKAQKLEGQIGAGSPVVKVTIDATGCSNPDCRQATYNATIQPLVFNKQAVGYVVDQSRGPLLDRRLLPLGTAQPQPAYIPAPLVEDYREACAIVEDSPKAAATLARRCLQGMIRDFAGIAKKTLHAEIQALRTSIDEGTADRAIAIETVDAIDHVRKIGNIGAHMEADINQIVPVDPGEAQSLIGLIELLFAEWYVARHKRQERFAALAAMSEEKSRLRGTEAEPPPSA